MSIAIVVGPGEGKRVDCHLELDGTAFPADPWHDRAVVILGWWTENHLAMRESGAPVRNSFMEGPYEFTVTPAGETLTLGLVRRGRDADEQVGEHAVPAADYERALVAAAESALAAAAPDRDRETLRSNLEALRRLLS